MVQSSPNKGPLHGENALEMQVPITEKDTMPKNQLHYHLSTQYLLKLFHVAQESLMILQEGRQVIYHTQQVNSYFLLLVIVK